MFPSVSGAYLTTDMGQVIPMAKEMTFWGVTFQPIMEPTSRDFMPEQRLFITNISSPWTLTVAIQSVRACPALQDVWRDVYHLAGLEAVVQDTLGWGTCPHLAVPPFPPSPGGLEQHPEVSLPS